MVRHAEYPFWYIVLLSCHVPQTLGSTTCWFDMQLCPTSSCELRQAMLSGKLLGVSATMRQPTKSMSSPWPVDRKCGSRPGERLTLAFLRVLILNPSQYSSWAADWTTASYHARLHQQMSKNSIRLVSTHGRSTFCMVTDIGKCLSVPAFYTCPNRHSIDKR